MTRKKIVNPHDKFFASSIGHIKVARQLFEQYLPKHIQSDIDFDSLMLWQNKFTGDNLQSTIADAVYQPKFGS